AGVAPPRSRGGAGGAVVLEHAGDADRTHQVRHARLCADVAHAPVAQRRVGVVGIEATHRDLRRVDAELEAAVVEVERTVDAALLDLCELAGVPDALHLGTNLLGRELGIDRAVGVGERSGLVGIPGTGHDRQAGVEPVFLRPVAAAVRANGAGVGAGSGEGRVAAAGDRV